MIRAGKEFKREERHKGRKRGRKGSEGRVGVCSEGKSGTREERENWG